MASSGAGQGTGVAIEDSFSTSHAYVAFRNTVPLRSTRLGVKTIEWRYYDYGPRNAEAVFCLTDVAGTPECFYKQVMGLSSKGLRIISVDYPLVENKVEFVEALNVFIEHLHPHDNKIHLVGLGLGGYLFQEYAHVHPSHVASLVLTNSFSDTTHFFNKAPCLPVLSWTPDFLLKQSILANFPQGNLEEDIRRSVDFTVEQLETLNHAALVTRLRLQCAPSNMQPCPLPSQAIMIMEVCDDIYIPTELTEEVSKYYPEARVASLKDGGNFPQLSRADEVNMYILVHLRSMGCVATPTQPAVGATTTSGGDENGKGELLEEDEVVSVGVPGSSVQGSKGGVPTSTTGSEPPLSSHPSVVPSGAGGESGGPTDKATSSKEEKVEKVEKAEGEEEEEDGDEEEDDGEETEEEGEGEGDDDEEKSGKAAPPKGGEERVATTPSA